jgi:hypothetical protein
VPDDAASRSQVWRGVIHFHTRHSSDGVITERGVLRLARREHLDFVIVTDHDTVDGALRVQELAAARGLDLEVPLAAEYLTDCGDVIAACLVREVRSRRFEEFVEEVRAQEGILLLPHPFHAHRDVERLAATVDLIEVFNGRQSPADNKAAQELASRHGKPTYFASDAHLPWNAGRVIVEVDRCGSLRESLIAGRIRAISITPSDRTEIRVSQAIKALRTRDVRLLAFTLLQPVYRRVRRFLALTRR